MKVSVVVTVFNKEPFLKECFDSILAQDLDDFEVIAVDDWSTDSGPDLIRAIDDRRVRMIRTERNLGPAGAAQRGIDLARGQYIVRVDADDICLPGRFSRQVELMDARPDLCASGGHLRLFGAEEGLWRFPVGEDACRAEVLFGNPIAQPTAIMRADFLRKHNLRFGDDWPRIGEDWMLWARMLQHGSMDNIDAPLVEYRRGAQNSTHGTRRADYRSVILEDVFALYGIPFDQERCALHLMALRSFRSKPDERLIAGFYGWLQELKELNTRRRLFPEPAFTERLDRAWQDLFYMVSDIDPLLGLRHWLKGPVRDARRLVYLGKLGLGRLRDRRSDDRA